MLMKHCRIVKINYILNFLLYYTTGGTDNNFAFGKKETFQSYAPYACTCDARAHLPHRLNAHKHVLGLCALVSVVPVCTHMHVDACTCVGGNCPV